MAALLTVRSHPNIAHTPSRLSPAPQTDMPHDVPEEDDNNETSSEPQEPITPTSDTPHPHSLPHSHTFPNPPSNRQSPALGAKELPSLPPLQAVRSVPQLASPSYQMNPRTDSFATKPQGTAGGAAADRGAQRPNAFRRATSFLKGKSSTQKKPDTKANGSVMAPTPAAAATFGAGTVNWEAPASARPVTSAADRSATASPGQSAPAPVPTPAKRRLPSFSLSSRNSPNASPSDSPPSPSSPVATFAKDEQQPLDASSLNAGKGAHKQSYSSSELNNLAAPSAPHIKFAGGQQDLSRRRSSEFPNAKFRHPNQAIDEDDGVPQPLTFSFSKGASEGVGLKARRLSTSLPDQFVVDFCPLENEYVTTSRISFKKGKLIGKGATATVRIMARKGAPTELYAVKEFRGREKDEDEKDYIDKVKSEFTIAKSLHHPNIVSTERLCTSNDRWNHVMEFCGHGEMYQYVEAGLFLNDTWRKEDRLCFFKQIIRGVDYLHSHGIAHRDIKLENMLLTTDGVVKISDFGVSDVFCGEHPGVRSARGECGKNMGEVRLCAPGICGSMPYIAPEVLAKKGPYDPRPLDVWSCGIVYIIMCVGGFAWPSAKPEVKGYRIFLDGWEKFLEGNPDREVTDAPDGMPRIGRVFNGCDSPGMQRLVVRMLHPDPKKRMSIREVLNSLVIKNIECCSPESFEDTKAGTVNAITGKVTGRMILKKHSHSPPKKPVLPKSLHHRFHHDS